MATAAPIGTQPVVTVPNETFTTGSRLTQGGAKITYKLEIIQQPERARACGSGAKSSADRRPVDPPPIVSLRIFEGPNAENEITFSHNCNFALYASLENARPLAHGRGTGPTPPANPVLTGQPISGMSLLDRPKPAGYFIFPDLSVRHEGKYRLIFSLYEAPKERKDYPVVTAENQEWANDHHLQFRVEVKSKVFTVFSAKKFPGLTESTQLSRVIAEQGCRVRIRRDVRMRRRGETQKRGDYDEGEYDRARGSATPDVYGHGAAGTPQADGADRPRSVSNASQVGGYRPPSIELAQNYQSQYASPITPQAMYPNGQMQQWPQVPQPMTYMQPPPAPPGYPPQQPYQQAPAPPVGAPYPGAFMAPQYPVPNGVPHTRNSSIEFPAPPMGPSQHVTTPVSGYPAPPMQAMSPYAPTNFSRPLHPQPQQMPPPQQLLQLQPLQTHQPLPHQAMGPGSAYSSPPAHSPVASAEHAAATYAAVEPTTLAQQAHTSPISHMPVMTAQQNGYPTYLAAAPPPKMQMAPSASGATKRTFASTFDTEHMDGRMQQGARPNAQAEDVKGYGWDSATPGDDTNYLDDDTAPMLYRRADGTEKRRTVPFAQ